MVPRFQQFLFVLRYPCLQSLHLLRWESASLHTQCLNIYLHLLALTCGVDVRGAVISVVDPDFDAVKLIDLGTHIPSAIRQASMQFGSTRHGDCQKDT